MWRIPGYCHSAKYLLRLQECGGFSELTGTLGPPVTHADTNTVHGTIELLWLSSLNQTVLHLQSDDHLKKKVHLGSEE